MDDRELKQLAQYFDASLIMTQRTGIPNVLHQLEIGGFYTSPASSRYHLAREGGLLEHSVNVYRAAQDLIQMEPHLMYDELSLAIVCLLHDVCKMGRYKKREPNEPIPYETLYDRDPYGHGEKSVILLQQWGLRLTEEEIVAIRWHMGAWGVNTRYYDEMASYNAAVKKYPLVTILQMADQYATNIIER